MSTAILCPGQGAQHLGMGVDWVAGSPVAKRVFERSSEAIGLDLLALCAKGPLTRTDVCQPAILATSAACLAALEERGEIDRADFGFALGLSLGEYTALHVAGVLDLADAVKLVRLRGEAMQQASDLVACGMSSLIGADRETAEKICAEATVDTGVCVVANLNSPGQVVISGDNSALDRAEAAAQNHGIRRAIRLDVAGAFHSPLMEPARERLEAAIAQTRFGPGRCPVVGNVTAEPSTDTRILKQNLISQLTSPVLFEASLRRVIADGATRAVELSPGRVLTGLVKKVDRKFAVETYERAIA